MPGVDILLPQPQSDPCESLMRILIWGVPAMPGCLPGCLPGWVAAWLAGCLPGWMPTWLAACGIGWLAAWADWMTACLPNSRAHGHQNPRGHQNRSFQHENGP